MHLVEQGSLRLLLLVKLSPLIYQYKTDTLRRIWWSKAVCAFFSLRSCLVSLPEYNRHIAAHLVEQGSLRLLPLAELPLLIT